MVTDDRVVVVSVCGRMGGECGLGVWYFAGEQQVGWTDRKGGYGVMWGVDLAPLIKHLLTPPDSP